MANVDFGGIQRGVIAGIGGASAPYRPARAGVKKHQYGLIYTSLPI